MPASSEAAKVASAGGRVVADLVVLAGWSSPVADQLLSLDVYGLRMLAVLMEAFWRGDLTVAGEIRLQAGLFGLDPISRRKLGWCVTREGKDGRDQGKASGPRVVSWAAADDPRRLLTFQRDEGPGA